MQFIVTINYYICMKKIFILLIIMLLSHVAFAQMRPKELETLKNDTTLYYGLGKMCESPDDATDNAKTALYANIARKCGANAIYIADNGDINTQLENIVKTFKERIDEKSSEKAVVEDDGKEEYQYIITLKRSDFREMCNERRNDIQRYITKGLKMEENACFEDALK